MSKEKQLEIIGDELDSLMQRVTANHIRAGQKASGRTLQSIRKQISDAGGVLLGRAYFGVRFVILKWMKDKGISASPIPYVREPSARWKPKYTPQERGDLSLAGAIAYRIRKEGTSLYRNGGRDDIYSNEIPRTVENILDRIMTVFAKDVESININSINEEGSD